MAHKWLRYSRNGILKIRDSFTTAIIFAISGLSLILKKNTEKTYAGNSLARAQPIVAMGSAWMLRLLLEVIKTLKPIMPRWPYSYLKDEAIVNNVKSLLLSRSDYLEYTVPVYRAGNLQGRCIVCSDPLKQIGNCFYSSDHYNSFKHSVE